jgi:hypothetical protein
MKQLFVVVNECDYRLSSWMSQQLALIHTLGDICGPSYKIEDMERYNII